MLPYNGKQGNKLHSKMKKHLNKSLPTEVKTTVTYQSKKLGTKFQLKDKTRFNHQNNLVYYSKCPDKTCNEDYVGETDRKIEERIMDHNKRDKNSHLLKHSREKNHQHVWENDFKLLGNDWRSNFKRKISEALFIKQLKPSLNVKEKSIQMQLYNWFTIPVASTCLKLTKYTLEEHILCCSWFYYVKFEHVSVYRDKT